MRPGALRRRIRLYAQNRVDDGAGGWTEEWGVWGEVWAEFTPLDARERMEAMANNFEISGHVRVRYRPAMPFPVVFDYGGRYLESDGPPTDEGDRRRYTRYAVREVATWEPPEEVS